MIEYKDSIFHLGTEHWSCLLRINTLGLPEQIHFGEPIRTEDAQALQCVSKLGWGSSVLLDDNDPSTCLDSIPLAWSGCGRGDYRESPITLHQNECPVPCDFRYHSHRIIHGTLPMLSLPQASDATETLEITMEHVSGDIRLKLVMSVFPYAMSRRCILINSTNEPLFCSKIMSSCIDLPGRFEMTTFDGGWISEAHRHTVPLGEARSVNESTTGASSNRHNPGFLLSEPGATETSGVVYGFNLVYSGNHYSSAQRSLQGLNRVLQGISPDCFSLCLMPNESFETPEAILVWSGNGFGGLSGRMHDFVNRHIIPPRWRYRPRPVLFNSWEGCMFDFDHRRLLNLAQRAKKLGCELFVLDDGWFGKRNDDTAGLGDYAVNTKKLPGGLGRLSKQIRALGMEFGLWFEPECVNEDSDLYRAHPDWVLRDDLPPALGRHQLLLDLTKAEVRDYIVSSVSAVLDEAAVSYVKWDMNRHSIALGARAHQYILGLYDVLHRIFDPRPHILLESCSSGGNRFDLGMLNFSAQIWCSDDTDPIERLDIQNGLSYLYPQSTMGAHVSASPHAQTLRTTPLTTRGNVSFFGILGYELDLKHLTPVEIKEIRRQIEYYKLHRTVFQFGEFRRLELDNAVGWQVSGGEVHLAGIFQRLVHAAPGYERMKLRGLNRNRLYRVESRPQSLRVGQFGSLLKHVSPVSINPNGPLLRIADRHYEMMDGIQRLTASGAALMSGWILPPRFSGTGYDKNGRMQGDFGSNLFEIREVNNDEELR